VVVQQYTVADERALSVVAVGSLLGPDYFVFSVLAVRLPPWQTTSADLVVPPG
jgi:hypothetical protein